MGWPKFLRVNDAKLFRKFCERSFKRCDYDGNGCIEFKELHIGLLLLYDQINDVLPIHIDVPTHDEVVALGKSHDKDESGTLDFEEYYEICRDLFLTKRNWRKSIVLRVAINLGAKLLIFPFAGMLVKRAGMHVRVPGFKLIPEGLCVTAVEVAVNSIRPL